MAPGLALRMDTAQTPHPLGWSSVIKANDSPRSCAFLIALKLPRCEASASSSLASSKRD